MKGFPFTPESMQIIQMCWAVQSNFFRIAELKGMENKPVTPTSLFGIVVRFISKFSEIKLQSRKKIPWGCIVFSDCVFVKITDLPVSKDNCVFLLPPLLLICGERVVQSVLSEMQSLEKLLQFTKDIQIPIASLSDI